MRSNTKVNPFPSTTFERLRASLAQFGPLPAPFGPLPAPFAGLLTAIVTAVDLLASAHPATEAQLKACYFALERADRATSPWAPAPRSRAKLKTRLSKVIDEVLLVPRFAAAPMSTATVREIQSRMPRAPSRAAVLKAIQRRQARQVAP